MQVRGLRITKKFKGEFIMNKKIIIAIAVVLVLAISVGLAYPSIRSFVIRRDPVNHLMYSFDKISQETSVQTSSVMGVRLNKEESLEMGIFEFSSDEEAMFNFVNSLLENLTFVTNEAFELDTADGKLNFRGSANLDMKYAGSSMLDFEFVFEQWEWLMKSEILHSQPFLMDINEILNEAIDFSVDGVTNINIDEYIGIVTDTNTQEWKNFEKNLPIYEAYLREFIEPRLVEKGKNVIMINSDTGEEIDVVQYEIAFNMTEYYDFIAVLLREAETDVELKALAKNTAVRLLEHALETKDYEVFGITTEEVQTALDDINNEWGTKWDEGLALMIESMDDAQEMFEMPGMQVSDYAYLVSIDRKDRVRQIAIDMNLGFMSINAVATYEAFGKDVVIKSVDQFENPVDVQQFIDDPVIGTEVGAEVATNFVSNFFSSEAFTTLIADVKEKSHMLPAEEREAMVQGIDMGLMQVNMMLPMLLQQMGM